MFAEFAIIPVTNSFESVANEIQDKLNGCSLTNITSSIDTNYSLPITIRINNWRDIQYDTIMIDQDYNETKTILVKFYDNNTIKSHNMQIDEFIELVSSFEDNDNEKETTIRMAGLFDDENIDIKSERDGFCIIS